MTTTTKNKFLVCGMQTEIAAKNNCMAKSNKKPIEATEVLSIVYSASFRLCGIK